MVFPGKVFQVENIKTDKCRRSHGLLSGEAFIEKLVVAQLAAALPILGQLEKCVVEMLFFNLKQETKYMFLTTWRAL